MTWRRNDGGRWVPWRLLRCRSGRAGQPAGAPGRAASLRADAERSGRRLVAVSLVLALVAGAAALVGARVAEPLPDASFTLTAAPMTVPGSRPRIAWPASGQAAVSVPAMGWRLASASSARPVPIASVAKVMTAYVVLGDHPLGASEPGPPVAITQPAVDEYRRGSAANGSELPVSLGQTLTQRQALDALLVASANDIAIALAIWDAGSVPAFVDRMNAAAARLGMASTTYADPAGLDGRTVSTAADQVVLAEAAMQSPAFAAVVAQPSAVLPGVGAFANYDFLAGKDGVVGVKTGSTLAAGGCFVAAVHRTVGGLDVTAFAAVLGQRGPDLIAAGVNAGAALAKAAAAAPVVTGVRRGDAVGTLRTRWSASDVVVDAAADAALLALPGDQVDVAVTPRRVGAPRRGEAVGRATVTASGPDRADVTAGVTVRARSSVPSPSVWWRVVHG